MSPHSRGGESGPDVPDPDARDPLVARALRTLPAPEHGPTFWAELDRHLDAVDGERAGAGPPGTAHPLEADGTDRAPDRRSATGDLPRLVVLDGGAGDRERRGAHAAAGRRDGNRRLVALAAAVLLVAALVTGIATRPSNDGDDVEFADAPPSTSPASSAPVTSAPPVTATAPPGTPVTEPGGDDIPAEPTSASEAVLAFVTALADGDGERAEALLGEASRDAMADMGIAIEDLFESPYAAWGALGVPELEVSESPLLSSGEGTLWAVVLRGIIGPVEGGPADGEFVTPFLVFDANNVAPYVVDIYPTGFDVEALGPELVQPAPGESGLEPLEQGAPIEFLAPAADEAYVSIDGGELQAAALVGGTWTYDPGTLDPGPVSVVVFTLGAAGFGNDAGITEVIPAEG